MDTFERDQNIQNILSAFKEIDEKREAFNKTFKVVISKIISNYFPENIGSNEMDELLLSHAIQLQNITDSVIDKDEFYAPFRLETELQTVTSLAAKATDEGYEPEFKEELTNEMKALMVASNEKVFQLSGDGFRLLEVNSRMMVHYFLTALRSLGDKE